MRRSAISRDSIRRSGDVSDGGGGGGGGAAASFVDYEYELVNVVIPNGVGGLLELASASADSVVGFPGRAAPVIGGPYAQYALFINCIQNNATGDLIFELRNSNVGLGQFLTVPVGGTGVRSMTRAGVFTDTDTLGLVTLNTTGVGNVTLRARIRLS